MFRLSHVLHHVTYSSQSPQLQSVSARQQFFTVLQFSLTLAAMAGHGWLGHHLGLRQGKWRSASLKTLPCTATCVGYSGICYSTSSSSYWQALPTCVGLLRRGVFVASSPLLVDGSVKSPDALSHRRLTEDFSHSSRKFSRLGGCPQRFGWRVQRWQWSHEVSGRAVARGMPSPLHDIAQQAVTTSECPLTSWHGASTLVSCNFQMCAPQHLWLR